MIINSYLSLHFGLFLFLFFWLLLHFWKNSSLCLVFILSCFYFFVCFYFLVLWEKCVEVCVFWSFFVVFCCCSFHIFCCIFHVDFRGAIFDLTAPPPTPPPPSSFSHILQSSSFPVLSVFWLRYGRTWNLGSGFASSYFLSITVSVTGKDENFLACCIPMCHILPYKSAFCETLRMG